MLELSMKSNILYRTIVIFGAVSFWGVSCRHTTPTASDKKDLDTSQSKVIFCKAEDGSWGLPDDVSCQFPFKVCYVGNRVDAITMVGTDGVAVSEDFAVRHATAGGGNSVKAKIWDMQNDLESSDISFGACRKSVLPVVVTPQPAPGSQASQVVKCLGDDGKYGFPEVTVCEYPWNLCFQTTPQDAVSEIQSSNGVTISEDHELRSPSILTGGTQVEAQVWDMPNDLHSDDVTFGKCTGN